MLFNLYLGNIGKHCMKQNVSTGIIYRKVTFLWIRKMNLGLQVWLSGWYVDNGPLVFNGMFSILTVLTVIWYNYNLTKIISYITYKNVRKWIENARKFRRRLMIWYPWIFKNESAYSLLCMSQLFLKRNNKFLNE